MRTAAAAAVVAVMVAAVGANSSVPDFLREGTCASVNTMDNFDLPKVFMLNNFKDN